jgi:hypothetical protein
VSNSDHTDINHKVLDIGIIVIKGIILYKHSNDNWCSNTNKILNIVNYTLQSKNICKNNNNNICTTNH